MTRAENIIKAKNQGFHITFNGSTTWMVIDSNDDSWGYYDTERKAYNRMSRIGKCYN